ncbi:hypothetical protein H2198_005017 [Neophaeococcomyces mojaviensis]|uniref:Uncharacterized protein n=1 Tax=Neophaeococcomyces mojaviensis TaxID=3383035 RepID=A0ACC3A6Z7_9EURO|nr:hypothetical protein H2198_005017 [Knufia sp. JES_112]
MSCTLLDLPDEILLRVLSYVDIFSCVQSKSYIGELTNSKPTLCALAVTNRRLSNIATNVLFESVDLDVDTNKPYSAAAKKLYRTYTERPDLLDYLRIFGLYWNIVDQEEEAVGLVKSICNAPNLTSLTLGQMRNYTPNFEDRRSEILEVIPQTCYNLEHLVLRFGGMHLSMSGKQLFNICAMPRLRHFETSLDICAPQIEPDMSEQHRNTTELVDASIVNSKTKLKHVACTGTHLSLRTLSTLFSKLLKLTDLTLSLPGPGIKWHDQHLYYWYNEIEARFVESSGFSPHAVSQILTPLAATLESLTIMSGLVNVTKHDDSSLNLKQFDKLKYLTLSIRLLCSSTQYNSGLLSPGSTWYECLPSSLQMLEIMYDCSNGLLWRPERIERPELGPFTPRTDAYTESFPETHMYFSKHIFEPCMAMVAAYERRLAWINGLLKWRSEQFPQLKKFRVVEVLNIGWATSADWDQLNVAQMYPELFKSQGLELDIIVRVPKGYVAPPLAWLTTRIKW